MLSAEDITAATVAVSLCNGSEVKREIFTIPVTVEGLASFFSNDEDRIHDVKIQWDENMEKKTSIILEKLGLAKSLQGKVINYVLLIGMRMLTWVKYYEGIIGFPRDFGICFLKISLFTWRGIIDYKKAAEELMKCKGLNVKQKYKLACHHCFVDEFPVLWKQMTKKEQQEFFHAQDPDRIDIPKLVKFWSYNVMGISNRLAKLEKLDEYFLQIAIKSGNKSAVEYRFGKTEIHHEFETPMIIKIILEAVDFRKCVIDCTYDDVSCKDYVNDWMAFVPLNDYHRLYLWNPKDCFIDMLCFLFNRMTEEQQVELLMKDVDFEIPNFVLYAIEYYGVLYYFLFWPYQENFMKAVNLMWEFLPEWVFADLLGKISNYIEPTKGTLIHGEGITFNYRILLREFWCAAPLRYKRYLFSNKHVDRDHYKKVLKLYKYCFKVFYNIFFKNNFTNEDRRIFELIIESATEKEKRNIFHSFGGKSMLTDLIESEKWGRFDVYVSYFFSSTEEANKFKSEFITLKKAQNICIKLVKHEKWEAAESFLRWTAFSEEEIIQLKKKMILSDHVKKSFKDLILRNSTLNVANKFWEWFSPSEDELREFKNNIIFPEFGDEICSELLRKEKFGQIDEFISDCLSSEEDIAKFRQNLASKHGGELCKNLISKWNRDYPKWHDIYEEDEETDNYAIRFGGGKWKQVEEFLTWGFSSPEEINIFKRIKIFEEFGEMILYSLIYANQLKEANTFFSFLNLSLNEIKDLKKETVSTHMSEIYKSVSSMWPERFLHWDGDRKKNAEVFLRWLLIDKKSAREFKDRFDGERKLKRRRVEGSDDEENFEDDISDEDIISLNKFYKFIAKLRRCLK